MRLLTIFILSLIHILQFLSRYSKEETDTILKFMQEFNVYLDEQIEQYITDSRESTEMCIRDRC